MPNLDPAAPSVGEAIAWTWLIPTVCPAAAEFCLVRTHGIDFFDPGSVSCSSRAAPGEGEAITLSTGHIVSCYPFYSPCIILKSNLKIS